MDSPARDEWSFPWDHGSASSQWGCPPQNDSWHFQLESEQPADHPQRVPLDASDGSDKLSLRGSTQLLIMGERIGDEFFQRNQYNQRNQWFQNAPPQTSASLISTSCIFPQQQSRESFEPLISLIVLITQIAGV